MKIIASMIESAQWQAWLSQQNSPYPIVTTSKKPCTDEVTIIAAPCSLVEIENDLLDYDQLLIYIWGLQATLANALRNGIDEESQIESVVSKWVDNTEQLLTWLPKHQHKVNLISHTHAAYFTQEWCECLNQLGIEWSQLDTAVTDQDEYDLFAAYYVKNHPQFDRLEQLLFSVALPLGEDYPHLPLNIVELARQNQNTIRHQRYKHKQLTERDTEIEQLRQEKITEQKKFEQQLTEIQQENDSAKAILDKEKSYIEKKFKQAEQQQQALAQENELVITELHRVQEALEALLQQNQQQTEHCNTLDQQVSESHQQNKQLEQQKSALEQQLNDAIQQKNTLEQENSMIIAELHRVQEALEIALQQHQQQTDKCSTLEQQLSASRAQQAKFEQLFADQQVQNARLSEQFATSQSTLQASEQQLSETTREQKALEQENSMIIAELHCVQEALERLYYEKITLQQQIDHQVQQLKAHSVKINHLIKRQRLTKLELAKTLADKTLLEQDLAAHHASALWKLATPVRKLRQTSKRKRAAQLAKQKLFIEFSDYFDKEWYIAQYADVIDSGLDPIEHYLRFGAQEGRNPSPDFDTLWYLKTYPDVAESDVNPLVHFIQYGEREERQTSAKLLELKPV